MRIAPPTTRHGEHKVRSQGVRDRRALTGEAGNAPRRKVIVGDASMNPVRDECASDAGPSRPNDSRVMRTNFGGTMAEIFREHSGSLEYDSQVNELTVFPDLKTAQNWLINNQLDTSGTSILVPFKNENDKVHFLKPSNLNISSDLKKTFHDEVNKDIRIMGAANNNHIHGFFRNIQAAFTAKRVPHLNELEGDNIDLNDHGFIIIYEKGEKKAGHAFFNLFEEEKKDLIEEIKKAQTNEAPLINQAKFLENLSKLAIDLEIKGGMCYFFGTDKNGKQHVYRDCFQQDASNVKLEKYLKDEKKWHASQQVKIIEHKSQNHHLFNFLKDWFKSTSFAAITAIGAGLILGIFIAPPLGTIVAALVAVLTFIGISSYGFYKADKNNPITIEYGSTEFQTESEDVSSSRITQIVTDLKDFFVTKPSKAITVPKNASTTVSSLFSLPAKPAASLSENNQFLNAHVSLRN